MAGRVTFRGNPLTLVGRSIKLGSGAPGFRVTSQELKEVSLSDLGDKIKVVSTFPSLDTPVCDLQVKEFNKRATSFSPDVLVVGISKDLPFAQRRFCDSFGIKNELVLSDYKTSSFGINYGLLIRELNLLARSVLILDKNNVLRYFQIAGELTSALDFEAAVTALQEVVKNPAIRAGDESLGHCKPCEGQVPAMPKDQIDKLIAKYNGWELLEEKKLVKEFKFKDFIEAKYFLDLISLVAEEEGHHPTLTIMYNKLRVTLTTHAAGGLTENDFIMAKIIDGLAA